MRRLLFALVLVASCTPKQMRAVRPIVEAVGQLAEQLCDATDTEEVCLLKCLSYLDGVQRGAYVGGVPPEPHTPED